MSDKRFTANFLAADGFPMTRNTMDKLQSGLRQMEQFGFLGSAANAYIISGCTPSGGAVGDGYIWYNGKVYPLLGATVNTYIQIVITQTDDVYIGPGGSSTQHKWTEEQFQFRSTIGIGAAYGAALTWATDVKSLQTLEALSSPNDFAALTLAAHWTGGNLNYIKEPSTLKLYDKVHITGLLQKDTTTSNNEVLGTLPSGFRPSAAIQFSRRGNTDTVFIEIQTNGNIVWKGGAVTMSEYVPINGIYFFVAKS